MPISRELLSDIKIRLDITWEDEATDIKINSLAEDGMFYIDEKLGDAGDYTTPGYPRMLLMEYVRYARDNAVDVFENNYITHILSMQNKKAVEKYVEETEPSQP